MAKVILSSILNITLFCLAKVASSNILNSGFNLLINRLAPELRMFEDSTLAKQNKVMFRIEERITLAIFNNNAVVKGTLTAP